MLDKITELVLVFVIVVIVYSQYLFFSGNELYGIFVGLWAPTMLAMYNLLTLREIKNNNFEKQRGNLSGKQNNIK